MQKIAILLTLVSGASVHCMAQQRDNPRNPWKYALIADDGSSVRAAHHPVGAFFNDKPGYLRYVDGIMLTYTTIFNLAKAQQSSLQRSLAGLYNRTGIYAADVHLFLGGKFRAELTYSQYLQWRGLKNYPEYSYQLNPENSYRLN